MKLIFWEASVAAVAPVSWLASALVGWSASAIDQALAAVASNPADEINHAMNVSLRY